MSVHYSCSVCIFLSHILMSRTRSQMVMKYLFSQLTVGHVTFAGLVKGVEKVR